MRLAYRSHSTAILAFLPKYSDRNGLGQGVCLPDLSPWEAAKIGATHHRLKREPCQTDGIKGPHVPLPIPAFQRVVDLPSHPACCRISTVGPPPDAPSNHCLLSGL